MKKLHYTVFMIIVISITSILASTTIAENNQFKIRNSIRFGDTIDIVKTKETSELINERTKEDMNSDYSYQIRGILDASYELVYKDIVAGTSDTLVSYYFDDEGKLYNIQYQFPSYDTLGRIKFNDTYEKIGKSLKKKYGKPLDKDSYINLMIGYIIGENIRMKRNDEYSSWIVEGNDYNVKIDYMKKFGTIIYLEYYTFTNSEFLETIADILSEYSKTDDDI